MNKPVISLRQPNQQSHSGEAFALAGDIVSTVLRADKMGFERRLSEAIRDTFNWTESYCCLMGRAAHLSESHTLPEEWRELMEQIAREEQTVWLAADGDDSDVARLGSPLTVQGEIVGRLCVAASLAALPTFQSLTTLVAQTLLVRLQYDERKQALSRSEEQLVHQQQIIDQINDSVISMDLSGYITGWNKGAEQQFGYSAEEAIGRNILFLYADEEEEDLMFNESFLEHGGREMVVKRRKKSGEVFWASLSLSLSRDAQGNPTALLGYLVDITDRLKAEEDLRLQAAIFEYSDEGIIVTDVTRRILSVNRSFTKITGFEAHEAIGQFPSILKSGRQDQAFYEEMNALIADNGSWAGELWNRRKTGEHFPVSISICGVRNKEGVITHYFAVFTDLTERKNAEEQISRLAYYDTLSGLPNRENMFTLLRQALQKAKRNATYSAVLFIDLNRFKQVNDTLGHAAGDMLLRETAKRLTASVRGEDIVSRIGGDEFVVVLVEIAKREHAAVVANKILDSLLQPLMVDGHELQIPASIGISIYPDDGEDAETLIKNADVAMYGAKKGEGLEGHLFFSHDMNQRALERLTLEGNLRRALEREELSLYYQPQLDLTSGKIIGAEVLLRWNHVGAGMISPDEFIPVAEETGLIIPIGQWVLDTVCARIKAWERAGLPIVRLAVNISAKQFRPKLPILLAEILARHELDASYLELEITESMIMQNVENVIAMMGNFRRLGVDLSLDDFGTGYSSLSYLKRFPIDKLKIDQSFVRGIIQDDDDKAITRAIISLAKNLGLRVIAEGVETEAQLDFLRAAGCEEIQGYYYSSPLPEDEFIEFLQLQNGVAESSSRHL